MIEGLGEDFRIPGVRRERMKGRTTTILLPVFLLLALSGRYCPAQELLITEFMASNDNGLRDEDGESSDWIEIHNSGLEVVELEGWYLADSAAAVRRWRGRLHAQGVGEEDLARLFGARHAHRDLRARDRRHQHAHSR